MTSFAIAPTKSATTLFSEDGLTFSNDHITIFLVLICAWKMYVVDACFYMNDIHGKKYITKLAYWPIFIKNGLWKIVQIYIIHSASTIVWITIKHISQCLHIVVSNTYCVVFLSCFSSSLCILCCQFLSIVHFCIDHSVFSNVHTIYSMILSMILLAIGKHLHDRIMSIIRKF
jgi:hypothetical protein